MISVLNLVKHFGQRQAVKGVSFEVGRGVVLGFLGPNGAGKTTTMRMITGYLLPTSGTALVDGIDVLEKPVEARRRIGYLPENVPSYEDMSVESFLRFVAEVRGFRGRERNVQAAAVIEKCLLNDVRRQTIQTLSKGYRQRTGFAQAILHDPPVLILDEPTEGLDPNQKHVVRGMIREMGRAKTIVLSTHVLEEVEAICSRIIIISGGSLVADSTPAELKRRSSYFNAVNVEVAQPEHVARDAFKGLQNVARIEVAGTSDGFTNFRILARDGKSIIGEVLAVARSKQWDVRNIGTDSGRLDEVFRNLTSTADTTESAARGT